MLVVTLVTASSCVFVSQSNGLPETEQIHGLLGNLKAHVMGVNVQQTLFNYNFSGNRSFYWPGLVKTKAKHQKVCVWQ